MERHQTKTDAEALAGRVASRLAQIEGVEAVVLGGSWARGAATPDSDIDLGVYYDPAQPPSLDDLQALAREIDDRHPADAVTGFGEWGPWINGGAWLVIEGRRVDWLYRDLDRVRLAIVDCHAGRITCDYQPGHPHGFHNHMYMAEVHFCRPLFDRTGALAALKERTVPYPPALRDAIVRKFMWEAEFSIGIAAKAPARRDVFYLSGCLFRAAASLVQVLFALNGQYFLNEKGSVDAIKSFALRPPEFEGVVTQALGGLSADPRNLEASVRAMEALARDVRELCNAHAPL